MKEIDEVYETVKDLSEHGHPDLLETYGKDLDIVLEQVKKNPKKVWTVIDSGNSGNPNGTDEIWSESLVITGYHLVNRFGYMITKEEWKNEDEVYIY
jgi:hypothetical protein